MDKFLKSIDKQIAFNQGKNIFLNGPAGNLKFIQETARAISEVGGINSETEELLIGYATDKVLQEFCRINQYYAFDEQATMDLREIYAGLFSDMRSHRDSTEELSRKHFQNLQQWLKKSNPFAEKVFADENETIEPVACSEYSPGLQLAILQIEPAGLMEPVLDIGCGRRGNLVKYLCQKGVDAYGFDRFSFDGPNFLKADWLAFDYGEDKWGTITSNLGFSNHFNHHHVREDGNFIGYAKTYMTILHALKVGGSFHYAPDLPFMERYLDANKYQIMRKNVEGYGFQSVVIKRLK